MTRHQMPGSRPAVLLPGIPAAPGAPTALPPVPKPAPRPPVDYGPIRARLTRRGRVTWDVDLVDDFLSHEGTWRVRGWTPAHARRRAARKADAALAKRFKKQNPETFEIYHPDESRRGGQR